MTYDVDINGRARRVEIERAGSGFIVAVDGRRHTADVTVVNGVWSLILEGGNGRRSYEVAVVEQPPRSGNFTVHLDGRVVSVAVGGARGPSARRGADPGSAHASSAAAVVTAPMPGKIVRVMVKAGDTVAARQGVVVVEAMKMENELRAPRAGTVAEVRVAEGASAEAGAILVVIE